MKKVLQYLQVTFGQADEAMNHLTISADRCKNFFDKGGYSEEELIELEALTGRFARMSDILTQKIFKTLDRLDGIAAGTVRDRILQAEKNNIITDAKTFLEIRDKRNTIAHEYELNSLKEMFVFVFQHTPFLNDALKRAKQYSKKFYTDNL
ncbi:MAG TPA: hypothetical protein VGP43_06335 [Chitinophagaceae bacterium]|nr:hypothetical protein [Chitinophagaceae bacterium]